MTKSSSEEKRISTLVEQLNTIARDQIAFMNFFPPLAEDIVIGLANYLGEEDCVKLANKEGEFSFSENYAQEGLGVEGGRFRIPVMVRIRDHESCKQIDEDDLISKNKKTKKTKSKKARKKAKKKEKLALEKGEKVGKKKTSKGKEKRKKLSKKRSRQSDCNETFLRFKLLCERIEDDKIIIDIAGTQKVTVHAGELDLLYAAIFKYLQNYFAPDKFFDKASEGYQNASYGFFRKHF